MPLEERASLGVFGCCFGGNPRDLVDDGNANESSIPKPRGCTDLVWLAVYVMFCCVMVLIGAFALVYGNPKRLINGMDSFGNVCGASNEDFGNMTFSGLDMTDKPFVFFLDLHDMDRSTKICVSECPNIQLNDMNDLKAYHLNSSVSYCRYDYDLSSRDPLSKMDEILCPKFPVYSSIPVLKRCIPNNSVRGKLVVGDKLFFNVYAYLNNLDIFKQILGDLAVTWVTVLQLTGLSFLISLILVIALRWITVLLSYVILIAASLLSTGLTAFLWLTYFEIKNQLDATDPSTILEELAKNERAFFIYSIAASVFTVILMLVILFIRKRVHIVVKLFREAGSVMFSMPCLIIQPIITYSALTLFFCGWLYVILCLATSDYPTSRQIPSIGLPSDEQVISTSSNLDDTSLELQDGSSLSRKNKTLSFEDFTGTTLIEYSDGAWVKYMWWIYIIGLIWCSEFILACQQMVISSSVSSWYFSRSRSGLRWVVLKSISRMIQYHIGSIALGSLIITTIKVPRLLLQMCQRVFRKWDEYRVIQWLSRCCVCCLQCFENCLKYIHHNAYTVISIQGVDFCPAAKLAFSALAQNALQISVINSIGDFILFLTKCITAALTGVIAMLVFRNDETLNFYAIPVLLTILFAYFVAHCVISVFEMAVDTLFLCFCEDHNMNDGTDGKEFYASKSLLEYMTKDAVDAVAPGRRSNLDVSSKFSTKKVPVDASDLRVAAEEIIPMNPYGETTTPND